MTARNLLVACALYLCSFYAPQAKACYTGWSAINYYDSTLMQSVAVHVYYPALEPGQDKAFDTYAASQGCDILFFGVGKNTSDQHFRWLFNNIIVNSNASIVVVPLLNDSTILDVSNYASVMNSCVSYMSSLRAQAGSLLYERCSRKISLGGFAEGANSALLCAQQRQNFTDFSLQNVLLLAPAKDPFGMAAIASLNCGLFIATGERDCESPWADIAEPYYYLAPTTCKTAVCFKALSHCAFADLGNGTCPDKTPSCTNGSNYQVHRIMMEGAIRDFLSPYTNTYEFQQNNSYIALHTTHVRAQSSLGLLSVPRLRYCVGDTVRLHSNAASNHIRWMPGGVSTEDYVFRAERSMDVRLFVDGICTGSDSASVHIEVGKATPVSIGASGSPCSVTGQKLSVFGYGFTSPHWSTGDTTLSIVVHDTGTYTFSYFDPSTCTPGSYVYRVNGISPGLQIKTSGDFISCGSDKGNFSLSSEYASDNVWSTGDTTAVLTITKPGDYHIWLRHYIYPGDERCSLVSDTMHFSIVHYDNPKPSIYRIAYLLGIEGKYALINWYKDDVLIANEHSNTMRASGIGRYHAWVSVDSISSCTNESDELTIHQILDVGDEIEAGSTLYATVFTDRLVLSHIPVNSDLGFYDALGRCVKVLHCQSVEMEIPTLEFSSGLYCVRCLSSQQSVVFRIVH